MEQGYELREMPLSLASARSAAQRLLEDNELRLDELDLFIGIFDPDDRLVGGGGVKGAVIKCVALNREIRSLGLSAPLISTLRAKALESHPNAFVFTKPENRKMFESLAFKTIAESPRAIMLESDPRGVGRVASRYAECRRKGRNGAIVMNCNPFTAGHEYLISRASKEVDHLYVIVVREDVSDFAYADRLDMVRRGCEKFKGVTVLDGSDYAVSSKTFPTYFIKEVTDATDAQIALDLDIFSRHIAPALGVSVRFAGSEPEDRLTARYNELMKQTLPGRGIQVREISRLALDGETVSASAIRRAVIDGNIGRYLPALPLHTIPHVLARAAAEALRCELHATPKPGLVDELDNGAHTDMDLALMERSIDALLPHFARLAKSVIEMGMTDAPALRQIGLEAEKAMFDATGGVNTHKGALFSFALTIAAASESLLKAGRVSLSALQSGISRIATSLPDPTCTHGSEISSRYGVKGAMQSAREGYPDLFGPYLRAWRETEGDPATTLMHIMATIEDTNVYHRAGREGAEYVRQTAAEWLDNPDKDTLARINADFITRNISPGGAADMLALTIFIDNILNTTNKNN